MQASGAPLISRLGDLSWAGLLRSATLLLILLGTLWLSTPFVHALLNLEAQRVVTTWASGATPFDIDFRRSESVISASNTGPDGARVDAAGLSLVSQGKSIGLTLRMPQVGLLQPGLNAVALDAQSDQIGQWKLLAYAADPGQHASVASGVLGAATVATRPVALHDPGWPIRALQLRLSLPPGSHLTLRTLRFIPAFTPDPRQVCVLAYLDDCTVDGIRLRIDPSDGVASLLTQVDQLHREHPGLAIEPAATAPGIKASIRAAWSSWLQRTQQRSLLLVVLAVATGLALLALVLGLHRPRSLAICALPLLLAMLIVLASGLPRDPLPIEAQLTGALGLLIAIGLSLRSPQLALIGSGKAWRDAGLFSVSGLLLLALLSDAWQPPELESMLRYLPWVLLQQWLLQRLIRPAWESACADAPSIIVGSAVCFALLHFPNPGLMLFSALGAAAWVWLGRRHRALLPLVLSHWLLGLAALALLSPTLLRNAEIGARFLMPR